MCFGRVSDFLANWHVLLIRNSALRLYPPVPINSRFCKEMTTLPVGGGPDGKAPLLVLEGMSVAFSIYHVQRCKDIWGPNADEFYPDRWDKLECPRWAYLPFNDGTRPCLGSMQSSHPMQE